MARKPNDDAVPEEQITAPKGQTLTSAQVRQYFADARQIQGDRTELNQQMSELVTNMVDRGANRKALSWARQLDKMDDQDAIAVIEGLCFLLEHHPSIGKQGDLVRQLAAMTDQTAAPAALN